MFGLSTAFGHAQAQVDLREDGFQPSLERQIGQMFGLSTAFGHAQAQVDLREDGFQPSLERQIGRPLDFVEYSGPCPLRMTFEQEYSS